LTNEFEGLHENFHVISVVDGLHIPILVPIVGEEDYYC
jgi:hypothetical protein